MIKTYSEKAERAFRQDENVKAIVEKPESKHEKYIKTRMQELKKTKEWVSKEED